MNTFYQWSASILIALGTTFTLQAQSVGIGIGSPDQSAKLHIESNNQGLLIPQISIGDVNNAAPVTAPAVGLLVWNTNNATVGGGGDGFYYWTGTQWARLSTSSGTDDQNLTGATLAGNNLTITIENGAATTVDLSSLVNDADAVIGNEYNTGFALAGTNLTLTDGGGARTVDLSALNESGRNGLRNVGNFIHLGGPLIENTTVSAGDFAMNFNLNGIGDFNIQDNGINHFTVLDNGTSSFGGDVEWRDENTAGTILAQLIDDGNDGRFIVRENGGVSVDLDANTQFVFNEQGLDRDFRVESDINANAFRVDAGTDRIGLGIGAPAEALHLFRADNDIAAVYATGAVQGSGMFYAGQSTTFGGGFGYDGDGTPAMIGGNDRITFFRRNNNVDTEVISYAYNNSTVRVNSLAGAGNRMVIANANGDLFTQAIPANGDITGVTAGAGLIGGGTVGTVTLNANADNGLNVNAAADRIRLGGNLVENTTITANALQMAFNLNGTGDFHIQDNGVNHFTVLDNGTIRFGGDVEWRDENTGGTLLANLIDDGNDGRFIVRENGNISVDLDANTQFVFNEQGLNRDFRVESDGNANMFRVDASTNRVGIGLAAPSEALHIQGGSRTTTGAVIGQHTTYGTHLLTAATANAPSVQIGAMAYNQVESGRLTFEESVPTYPTANGTYCGFNIRHNGNDNKLRFVSACTAETINLTLVRGGNVGVFTENPTARLSVNGTANKTGGGNWAVFSDERLKKNITDYNEGLSLITQVRTVNFSYNDKMSEIWGEDEVNKDRVYQGVIAQELQKIAPDMVREVRLDNDQNAEDSDYAANQAQRESFLEVDPNKFTYALINAVKEQQTMIEAQQAQIDELKATVQKLEANKK
jgi:hypothetical protein